MNSEQIRILVVDDELGMREGCRKILASEGYEVETAADGLAGLELFEQRGDFAAALVDLKMPQMGGIEVIERMREHDEDIALFVITAYAAIDSAVEATKRGAVGYIAKPFTPDELVLPLKHALDKRALSIEAKRLRQEHEKRLLEVALERSKCRTIINCMTDGVLVVNRDRQIVLRNAAAARIVPQCASLSLPAALTDLDCGGLQRLIEGSLLAATGPVISSKEVAVGDCVYMVNASPVLEPNGEVSGAVAVLRDITALKKLETAKSMFVSMVAHEIKSPLAAIEGSLYVLLKGAAGEDPVRAREMLERSLSRAKALRLMISELINLRAVETGNFVIKRSPIDIREVVAEATESCREKAKEKGIELRLSCEPGPGREDVLADKQAMFIVFENLVDNAIKYTPAKGHIRVRVEHDGTYVRASVQDDGIGMTPDEKSKAFDEFFRAKNEYTRRIPGTGLGLSLVKRLVEMHQGRVSVEAAPGKGSKFTVSLPTKE